MQENKLLRMYQKYNAGKIIRTVIMFIISFFMLYPFLWMLSASFTEEKQIFNFPFKLIPDPVTIRGYLDVWKYSTLDIPLTVNFFNSVKVSLIGMLGSLLSCSLAAYGYSKINFPGRDKIFIFKLASMMIPLQVLMIPTFMIYRAFHMIDTHAALYVPTFLGATFGTFLLRQAFSSIPMELNESAEIDGASNFRIYWQIIMPLSKTALAALFIFDFTFLWNNYETPLLYLRTPTKYTLPIALKVLQEDNRVIKYGGIMAGSVSSALPIIAVFIAAQKYFVGSITMTGIKG